MKILSTALCLLLTACSGVSRVPGNPARAELQAQFKQADSNGDENLSREETAAGLPRLSAHFDEIDLDQNARLNFAELWNYAQWRKIASTPPGRYRTVP